MDDARQLRTEHLQIAEMARELDEAVARPLPPEPVAFLHFRREFARVLTRHLKREEWLVYPLLMNSRDPAVRARAAALCRELAAFDLDFAAYGRAWPTPRIEGDWEGFRRETLAILDRLRRRIAAEDHELFPLIDDADPMPLRKAG